MEKNTQIFESVLTKLNIFLVGFVLTAIPLSMPMLGITNTCSLIGGCIGNISIYSLFYPYALLMLMGSVLTAFLRREIFQSWAKVVVTGQCIYSGVILISLLTYGVSDQFQRQETIFALMLFFSTLTIVTIIFQTIRVYCQLSYKNIIWIPVAFFLGVVSVPFGYHLLSLSLYNGPNLPYYPIGYFVRHIMDLVDAFLFQIPILRNQIVGYGVIVFGYGSVLAVLFPFLFFSSSYRRALAKHNKIVIILGSILLYALGALLFIGGFYLLFFYSISIGGFTMGMM